MEVVNNKLILNGYVMIKIKFGIIGILLYIINDRYYWECKKRCHKRRSRDTLDNFCNAKTITNVFNGIHNIDRTPSLHNHAPEAHRKTIIEVRKNLKEEAQSTCDKPSQILQEVTTDTPLITAPYMISTEAARKIIKPQRRKSLPTEPTLLKDINIPDRLRNTFNDDAFLLRESKVGDDIISIFSTRFELEKLIRANFWIMDGTFKIVPNMFLQMCTIHAPVGGINSRILPLVYVLMSSKN
jgi:hypothetical protein